MTGTEFRERLRNGLGRQILGGFLSVLLASAALGAWDLAASVERMSSKLDSMAARDDRQDARINRHDGRITYLERLNYNGARDE